MQEILEKIKPGDIILTGKRGFLLNSLPIRFSNFFKSGIKNRLWTHSAIYIGDDYIIESIISPSKGVIKRKLSDSYLKNEYDILTLRRIPYTKYNYSKVVNYCKSREKSGYDFKALTYFFLMEIIPSPLVSLISNDTVDQLLNNSNNYFCSELVAEALLMSGDYCFDRAPNQIRPLDFLRNSYCFQIIHEDKAKEPNWKNTVFNIGYFIGIIIWGIILISIVLSILIIIATAFIFFLGKTKKKDEPNIEPKVQNEL
jgi:hypothetical protein